MKLEFEEFRESMLDKLYDSDSTVFILKTNSDDIISCDIRWRQGWVIITIFILIILIKKFLLMKLKKLLLSRSNI